MKCASGRKFLNCIYVDKMACLFAALLIMTVPLPWLAASFTAALLHELGHICVVLLCGGRITDLRIGLGGAVLHSGGMKPIHSILSIAAGPAVSLSLLFLFPWLPRFALCGAAQGLFNLLPIFPLDGGRMVGELVCFLFSDRTAGIIRKTVETIFLLMLGICILAGAFTLLFTRFG